MDKLQVALRKQEKQVLRAVRKVVPNARSITLQSQVGVNNGMTLYVWIGREISHTLYADSRLLTTKQLVQRIQQGGLTVC